MARGGYDAHKPPLARSEMQMPWLRAVNWLCAQERLRRKKQEKKDEKQEKKEIEVSSYHNEQDAPASNDAAIFKTLPVEVFVDAVSYDAAESKILPIEVSDGDFDTFILDEYTLPRSETSSVEVFDCEDAHLLVDSTQNIVRFANGSEHMPLDDDDEQYEYGDVETQAIQRSMALGAAGTRSRRPTTSLAATPSAASASLAATSVATAPAVRAAGMACPRSSLASTTGPASTSTTATTSSSSSNITAASAEAVLTNKLAEITQAVTQSVTHAVIHEVFVKLDARLDKRTTQLLDVVEHATTRFNGAANTMKTLAKREHGNSQIFRIVFHQLKILRHDLGKVFDVVFVDDSSSEKGG